MPRVQRNEYVSFSDFVKTVHIPFCIVVSRTTMQNPVAQKHLETVLG